MDRTRIAACMNEWMRRFIEDPRAFEAEFEAVREFEEAADLGAVPTYGDTCAAYLEQIEVDLFGAPTAPEAVPDVVDAASPTLVERFWRGVIVAANGMLRAAGVRGGDEPAVVMRSTDGRMTVDMGQRVTTIRSRRPT